MLIALVLACALQAPKTVTDIQNRVPKTPWVISLAVSGWKSDDKNPLQKELGDKLITCGSMEPTGTLLTLIAEPNTELISPAAWRKRIAPDGKPFECQLSACCDASLEVDGKSMLSDYHAFTCAAGYCFDLHVSRVSPDGKQALAQSEFENLVKSMRVLLLRHGWAEDYPDDVGYDMTIAALAGPGRKGWKSAYLPKHDDEWQVHFVEAEFLRFDKAPAEEQIAEYQKALTLIAKLEKPGTKERFAWAMICDGLSLAQYDAKLYGDSIVPLQKGLALLTELARKERASLAYNLACAQALTDHAPEATEALRKAIDVDEHYRERAAKDTDFDKVKGTTAFKKLLGKLATAPAPTPAK